MEKPPQKKNILLRRPLASIAILLAAILALVLGLIFGLRAKHHSYPGLDSSGSDFAEAWNQPSEFLLSKNFSISRTPMTRHYEWIISQQTIAPDGLERTMLLVNGMFSWLSCLVEYYVWLHAKANVDDEQWMHRNVPRSVGRGKYWRQDCGQGHQQYCERHCYPLARHVSKW